MLLHRAGFIRITSPKHIDFGEKLLHWQFAASIALYSAALRLHLVSWSTRHGNKWLMRSVHGFP